MKPGEASHRLTEQGSLSAFSWFWERTFSQPAAVCVFHFCGIVIHFHVMYTSPVFPPRAVYSRLHYTLSSVAVDFSKLLNYKDKVTIFEIGIPLAL
jgi:hypothetical protein